MLLASSLLAGTSSYVYLSQNKKKPMQTTISQFFRPFSPFTMCQALATRDDLERMKSIHTNIYVWGEGIQVDATQDFSNFTPKKIRAFQDKKGPDIVDAAFGWFHEAYIDKQGNLYVCAKEKMPSVKVREQPDGIRELTKVTSLPKDVKVSQVSFTRKRMFVVTTDGSLYSFRIVEQERKHDMFSSRMASWTGKLLIDQPIHVKELSEVKQISAGQDHLLALDYNGTVFAMGDDSFGQCGQGGEGRALTAPFYQTAIMTPTKVELPPEDKIVKVVSGYRHSLAISESGQLYGWGFNSQQQLSHEEEYSDAENPQHAIMEPVLLNKGELENKFVVDAAAGEEHTVVVAQIRRDNKCISELIFACGNNLKGQLGINRTCHVTGWTLVDDISELFDQSGEGGLTPLHVHKIVCGRRHCMAAFEYGAFFFWGDNEHGQLGNRKRSFVESPYPKRKFELYHNVENVIADVDSCAVIVESQGEKNVPKRKKKAKRSISASEILNSDEAIKAANEARMNKQKELDAAAMEKRVPLDQRFRTGWHKFMYGGGQTEQENPEQIENSNQKGQENKTEQ